MASSLPWKIKYLFQFFLLLITTTYACSSGQEEQEESVIAAPACLDLLKDCWLPLITNRSAILQDKSVTHTHTHTPRFLNFPSTAKFHFLSKEDALRQTCPKESHPYKSPSKYKNDEMEKNRS